MPTTWGAPIPGRSLGCLFSAQTAKGTAVTPATETGARFNVTSDAGTVKVWGLGSKSPILLKEGEASVPFELTIPMVQEETLIAYAARNAGGELDWLTLGFGVKFDGTGTPTQWAWQVQDCKIARARFHLAANGYLEATLSGTGGLITELSSFTPVNESTRFPYKGYEAVLTKAGSAFEVIDWTEEVDHNVELEHVIRGATVASFQRGWTYQTEGYEDITGSFTLRQKSGINMQANTHVTNASVLTLTSLQDATKQIIFTYAGIKFPSERFAGADEGATFELPYLATTRTITTS